LEAAAIFPNPTGAPNQGFRIAGLIHSGLWDFCNGKMAKIRKLQGIQ
jgi:hypothetical protein